MIAQAGAQVVFSCFSFAFFRCHRSTTVGAIVTLFVLMQATAHVDWGRVMSGEAIRAAR
jgi:hypothetical protein